MEINRPTVLTDYYLSIVHLLHSGRVSASGNISVL